MENVRRVPLTNYMKCFHSEKTGKFIIIIQSPPTLIIFVHTNCF